MTAPDGLLVVDKPAGWTSHDVVARSRRLCATRKVGHAGTLDPMATGVLVLGIGRATRFITHLQHADKDYAATIRLGQATVTDDAEGEVTAADGVSPDTADALAAAVAGLTGELLQRPSAVSAIKVDGQRAYKRVRDGEQVELAARPVTVSAFDVHAVRETVADGIPLLDLDVTVSVTAGTYVRALARDLGAALGTGGHLTALRRTRVGRFTLADAHPLEALVARADAGEPMPVVPLADAAEAAFPVRRLTEQEATALGYGQRIPPSGAAQQGVVAAIAPDGRLIALIAETETAGVPDVVFAPAGS